MGNFTAVPVSSSIAPKLANELERRALKKITVNLARSLTRGSTIPAGKHYYVSRAVFYGDEGEIDHLPRGVVVSVNVQRDGVAYLQSYRLTAQTGLSTAPVILISDSRLSGVITMCGAAI
jgi:hypothetical protein